MAGLLLVALLVRGGVLWVLRDKLADDPDAYREIAENILQYGVFGLGKSGEPTPTAYRPPLYPIVLSNLPAADRMHVSLVKVALLHLALGLATVWLTWLTARRLLRGAGVSPALLASLLIACDPILLNQSALVMTETLAAFLSILSLWLLARFDASRNWWNAGLAGGAIALAALCRPTFLPWLGLVGVGMLVVRGNCKLLSANCNMQNEKKVGWLTSLGWRVANLAALVVVAAGVLSPWAIRNQQVFGQPMVTTTHGGYTLYLGNNDWFYGWLQYGQKMDDVPFAFSISPYPDRQHPEWGLHVDLKRRGAIAAELWDDQQHYQEAREAMSRSPVRCAQASLFRIRQLWSPLPYKLTADESIGRMLLRYATAAWYCGVYLLVAVGVWRLRWNLLRPPWVWGVLLCLAFTAVHTLYWCNLRMRAPLMPFVVLVAAAGSASLFRPAHSPSSSEVGRKRLPTP